MNLLYSVRELSIDSLRIPMRVCVVIASSFAVIPLLNRADENGGFRGHMKKYLAPLGPQTQPDCAGSVGLFTGLSVPLVTHQARHLE